MVIKIINAIILSIYSTMILRKFLKILFVEKTKTIISKFIWGIYFIGLIVSTWSENNAYLKLTIVILLSIVVSLVCYHGGIWKKTVFSISFNAMAMLSETLCGFTFMMLGIDYMIPKNIGLIVSKTILFLIIYLLEKIFKNIIVTELSRKYSLLLMLIPVGSIFVISNIFFLNTANSNMELMIFSMFSALIMLGINTIVFLVYEKIAIDAELQRLNTVYRQQVILYERYMNEKTLSMTTFRQAKHDLKQKLFVIVTLAREQKLDDIIVYVQNLITESGIENKGVIQTGNSIVDSILNYQYHLAKVNNIQFWSELIIPDKWKFDAGDICVILGNALDNAIEATMKVEEIERKIKIAMTYNNNNLSIIIINSFDGNIRKKNQNELLTTKEDTINHGLGLQSIQKVVDKYNGTVAFDYSEDQFCLRLLLYGSS